jgi:transcriptional regulator with XRE-family HTH domain
MLGLKKLREEYGWLSRRGLAREMGVSANSVKAAEKEGSFPTARHLVRFQKVTGIPKLKIWKVMEDAET